MPPRTKPPPGDGPDQGGSKHPKYRAIAQRLAKILRAMEWRQVDLCRRVEVSEQLCSMWLSGTSRPSLKHASLICDKTGATLDYIYRGDESGLKKRLADAIAALDDNLGTARAFPMVA